MKAVPPEIQYLYNIRNKFPLYDTGIGSNPFSIKKKITFDLTGEEYDNILNNKCYYCAGTNICNQIGIDRIDSDGDYIYENVVASCKICNIMKSDFKLRNNEDRRVIFFRSFQNKFINDLKRTSGLEWKELEEEFNCRCLRFAYRYEKCTLPLSLFLKICNFLRKLQDFQLIYLGREDSNIRMRKNSRSLDNRNREK